MKPGRIVVLGAGGLLGRHLVELLTAEGRAVVGFDRGACDITDRAAIERALDLASSLEGGATAVINCAAFTNVDRAESEVEAAFSANAEGPAQLARSAAQRGLYAIHLSTDFVFDGAKASPYDEADAPAPLSAYGRSKLEGERRFLQAMPAGAVVRVQGLYGAGGANFASRLPELLRAGKPLRLDSERRVQPTWAGAAARQLVALVDTELSGLVHLSCTGATTWAAYTRRLAERLGLPPRFEEVPSAALLAPAARPANCLFEHRVLRERGLLQLPSWELAQDGFLAAAAG